MRGRRTKIVCTLGPASNTEERIEALIRAGMDVARLNFSHGSYEDHAAALARVRRVAERLGRPVAVLQDLQGPKIRTGSLAGGESVRLRDGDHFVITTRQIPGSAERVSTTYAAFAQDVRPGDRVLLSDGNIELRVLRIDGPDVTTEVVHGGTLAEHQGINLPGVKVSAPALTEKDRADLVFGVRQQVDYIALSFVRSPDDLHAAQELIADAVREAPWAHEQRPAGLHASAYAAERTIPVIAKLEKPEALDQLDAILRASDGVMVARGDLGVEMPLEDVPLIQKRVIARANAFGIPVITATQMLESMIHSPRPTRAEASDVANAILDGTDAVMLSGETAVGDFPVEAVTVMARIAAVTESHAHPVAAEIVGNGQRPASLAHAVSSAAHTLAREADARLLAVFTRTGASAQLISKERPGMPVYAFTPFDTVYRRLALWWGVTPQMSELRGSTEELIAWLDAHLQSEGIVHPGDEIVIVGGMPIAGRARTNFVKLHRIGDV